MECTAAAVLRLRAQIVRSSPTIVISSGISLESDEDSQDGSRR
jgi:hypothetical protein